MSSKIVHEAHVLQTYLCPSRLDTTIDAVLNGDYVHVHYLFTKLLQMLIEKFLVDMRHDMDV